MKHFKPQGIPLRHLETIDLTREELEAIKLKDHDGLDQISAAQKMETSQSTFQRILSSGRKKVAKCLVQGKALKIVN
jgi:predicted DNA-binding protein (UPF0251 family)